MLEEIDLGEPDELPDVETVGGLIVTWLGRPPVKGDEFVFKESIRFKVLDVERRAVVRARIEFPDPDREAGGDTAVPPQDHDC